MASALALAIAVVALAGSAADAPRLGQWIGDLPTTTFLAALIMAVLALAQLVRLRSKLLGVILADIGLALLGSVLVALVANLHHPLADWWQHSVVGRSGSAALPSSTTVVGLAAWAFGLVLVWAGRPRLAQVAAAVPAMIGGLAILSFLYGDRLSIIRHSSVPNTATSAPTSYAFLLGALALLAATPQVGASAWITVDSTGRRAVRSLVPPVLALPLVVAGIARWTHLASSVGEARAWALAMAVITVGLVVTAAFAVGFIDRLAARAQDAELAELRLQSALRAAAVADLARSLAASVTAEEVAGVVNNGVCAVLHAGLASFGIVDPVAGVLRMQHGQAVDDDVAVQFDHPALDADLVITEAARTGELVVIGDYDEYRRRYPASDAGAAEFGSGARAGIPLSSRSGETFGALVASWDHPVDFDDTLRTTLATVGPLVAQSLERARMTDDLAVLASRNAALAELSEALAVAGGADDVVRVMCQRIAAPTGAARSIVGVIEPSGDSLRCSVEIKDSHELVDFVDALDSNRPLVTAARTGRVLLFGDRAAMAEEHGEGLDRFDGTGLSAAACVPLRNRDGEIFGSFGLGWDRAVHFDEHVMTLLSTIAELSAQTLQRAWLADERGRDAARARRLATFAQALAVAATSDTIVDVVGQHVAEIFRADAAELLLSGDGVVDVGRWPENTSATVPIMTAGVDRVHGWLCVRWPTVVPADESTLATLLTITELVSQTVDRANLAEAEHRLADDLQRRTLHPIPKLDDFDIAALYQPAAAELGMGGDWFEVVELDDGRLGLIVGDVVGHGVDAAAEMSQISGVLATLLRVGTPLGELFVRVHEAARVTEPRFLATASVVVVDRATGRSRYVSAGHPVPLVAASDGSVTALDGGRQPVIGMPPSRVVPGEIQLARGSTLFAYTDGLIERRGEDLSDGLDRLQAIVGAGAADTAQAQVDAAVAACTDGRVIEDDIALIALRRL